VRNDGKEKETEKEKRKTKNEKRKKRRAAGPISDKPGNLVAIYLRCACPLLDVWWNQSFRFVAVVTFASTAESAQCCKVGHKRHQRMMGG
jgi:hypothetical protein